MATAVAAAAATAATAGGVVHPDDRRTKGITGSNQAPWESDGRIDRERSE